MTLLKLLSVLIALSLSVASSAQAPGGAGQGASGHEQVEDLRTRGALSQSELKRLTQQIDQWNRVEGTAGVTPRVARSRTAAMLRVLNVSCAVSDAAYRGTAPADTEQHIYEAACKDGMGYLLMLHRSSLRGISCLASGLDESRVRCALPTNADSSVMAGTILNRNHIECEVRNLKWLGTSAENLDHVEVACESGASYVIRSPSPGSGGKLEVLGCQDASLHDVVCESSRSAPSASATDADGRPTLAWFNEALAGHGIECQTKRARIVGRESIKRRYVVEFECADRPEGLVAFVPPAGDTVSPFESMNCLSAAERGIQCELLSNAAATE